jgi:4-hydroxybenzoate polyprenyltransferase
VTGLPRALSPWLRLVRAPAALTAPGDTIAGAAAAGGRPRVSAAGASVLLYWAGMALNDYADRELDALERPERPIPSGEISPRAALAAASGLTAAGLALAALSGRRTLAVAVPLAASIWAYDLVLKDTGVGCASMAAARGLDVLMGGAAAGGVRAAVPAAAIMSAHTYAVTELSRAEVNGAERTLPATTLAATGLVAAAAVTHAGLIRDQDPVDRLAGLALAGTYLHGFARPQLTALSDPSAPNVRKAVGAGIHAMLPLQAALAAARGARISPLPLAAALPLVKRLSRKVSPT